MMVATTDTIPWLNSTSNHYFIDNTTLMKENIENTSYIGKEYKISTLIPFFTS